MVVPGGTNSRNNSSLFGTSSSFSVVTPVKFLAGSIEAGDQSKPNRVDGGGEQI